MNRIKLISIIAVLFGTGSLHAQIAALGGYCDKGATQAVTSGLSSTTTLQGIVPGGNNGCLINVYLTGTTTPATIYSNTSSGTLTNPFRADLSGHWLFWAAINQGYDVVASGGNPPNYYPQPKTLCTDCFVGFSFSGGGGGGGGCSTLGISTTNGSVTGDNTSTNCGYNNRTGDTATVPAETQTFGANLLDSNSGTDNVAMGIWAGDQNTGSVNVFIGDSAGQGNTSTASIFIGDSAGINNEGDTVVGIGENAGGASGTANHNFARFSDFIGGNSGFQNATLGPAIANGRYLDCMGFDSCGFLGSLEYLVGIGAFSGGGNDGGGEIVAIGNASGVGHSGSNIVAIGEGAGNGSNGNTAVAGNNIIGIGNGAGSGAAASGSEVISIGHGTGLDFSGNHDAIGIGHQALAGVGLLDAVNGPIPAPITGSELISLGDHALVANISGSGNVAIGQYAGSNGWVLGRVDSGGTLGNANISGSHNTWIGDFSGPNVTTQLSNSTALGYQAANDASNQIVLGNSSVTQFRVPAIKTISGIGCLQTDASGNITNTGSGCGGTGGSGTVSNFTAPSGGWPSWLNPTVVNSTTSPSLSVTALPIPNSALTNSALTINTVVCTLGGSCTIPSSGSVSSVANSDGTLTISPTTGSVVGSLNLAHANTWTAKQIQPAPVFSDITGVTQCLHVNTSGQVSGTGSDCGSGGGGGGSAWSALTNPTSNLILAMGANTSSFVYGATTGTGDLFRFIDTSGNTGTGIMGHFSTASGSTETPWQADANGVGWKVATDGSLQGVGASLYQGMRFPSASGLPTPVAASAGIYTDSSANLQVYENGGAFSRICTVGNIQCGSGGGGTPQYIAPQAIAGCGVQYVSGLTYTVGACNYSINGVTYNSPLSTITLPAADVTNPEIDVIFVDTTGVVQVIQGTAAVTPQQPVVDPSTQLQLTFVLVPATATTPANTTTVTIYDENTEWTSAKGGTSSANVTLASTNNPYHGTVDTEFGAGAAVATTTYAQYTDPSAGTVTLGNYNTLTFYLRNKAAWAKTRSVTVQWFNGATPLGTAVVLSNGAYGFNATGNFTSYQQVSIPTSTFAIANSPATTVRFTVSGSGANLTGFYLDFVTLQGGSGGIVLPTTLMNFKGPWTPSATYQPNDTVVSGGTGYVALASNTNIAVTTTATWSPLATATPSGFPVVLGSTSIAASSTTTAVTGLSVNGVSLTTGGSSTTFLNGAGSYSTPSVGAAPILASAEVVSFSATPTFSTSYNVSRIVLTGNITSFTLGAGSDGQDKTLCFAQDATGGRTVVAPAGVHGFFTVGTTASKWSCQVFSYDNTDSIWLSKSAGSINQ